MAAIFSQHHQTNQSIKSAVAHSTMSTVVQCSICAEMREPVELCHTCNHQEDKRICETCAIELHGGCHNPTCSCFGFQCAFCRQTDKTPRPWTDFSLLYWKTKAEDLSHRLDTCAAIIEQHLDISDVSLDIGEISSLSDIGPR